ncbi:MAG: hypothetical protein IPG02_16845 [Ignavibacteria bacterium]|nr:hypothetical protein [Ignavibacteria bacterium]
MATSRFISIFASGKQLKLSVYLFEIKKFKDVVPLIKKYHEKFSDTLFSGEIEISEGLRWQSKSAKDISRNLIRREAGTT